VTTDPPAGSEPRDVTMPLSSSEIDAAAVPDRDSGRDAPAASDSPTCSHLQGFSGAGQPDPTEGYELLRVLGEGAFARVYLARQTSLDRLVALKVTAHSGSEARVLASLDHDFIVRVFSESTDSGRQLLCMQYIAGATLGQVIQQIHRGSRPENGRAIVDAVDALNDESVAFDPAAMRDRARLESDDFIEAVCWMGSRLAEALAYAHSRGVLHCDIKPANVLVNRYGRPMLADFNVAATIGPEQAPRGHIGGTLSYMAPEHLEAFLGGSRDAVDVRSDIYSLGLVLFELLTGKRPFEMVTTGSMTRDRLERLAAERRAAAPAPRSIQADVPEVLNRVIRRCLAPLPEHRFQRADELAGALEGCHDLQSYHRAMPQPGPLTRAALRHPFRIGFCLFLLPHVLGSIVNISYNQLQIVHGLTAAQQVAFAHVTLIYNLVIYSFCIFVIVRLVLPILQVWGELRRGGLPDEARVAWVRRRALRLPTWAIVLSCLGWFPGALLFPLYLHLIAGSLQLDGFIHFLVSFTISGLIALTYAVFAAQYLAVRILYPRLWADPQGFQETARQELKTQSRHLWVFQLLAGLIPLAGAILMVAVGPDAVASYGTFRVLVTTLIALGMAGFGLALAVSQYLNHVLSALVGKAAQSRVR
jgi:serine/threonine protein kinase